LSPKDLAGSSEIVTDENLSNSILENGPHSAVDMTFNLSKCISVCISDRRHDLELG
jgi:hypothetical protein